MKTARDRRFNPWIGVGWIVFAGLIVVLVLAASMCSAILSGINDATTTLR
jgi:hypothetical protein